MLYVANEIGNLSCYIVANEIGHAVVCHLLTFFKINFF